VRPSSDLPELRFCGFNWRVKVGRQRGPGPNDWEADHAWVDKRGLMHLRIAQDEAGMWRCAEVISDESFGYGEYSFTISGRLNELDPNVVLGLFTYLDDHNEIDFELSRWGLVTDCDNSQFVIQPAGEERIFRFATGNSLRLAVVFDWTPARVYWQCRKEMGGTAGGKLLADWNYKGSGVPIASDERVHMNLWLMRGRPPIRESTAEVLIESFKFRAKSP